MDYPIGQQYLSSGKDPRLCTVVDIHRTYNAAGEMVKTRYVTTHKVWEQVVTEHDVVAVTIAKGIAAMERVA